MRKFSDKARESITNKQQKKARGAKEARDPEQEFRDALYRLEDGSYGIPAAALKGTAVSACRFTEGLAMTTARGAFHIIADEGSLVKLKCSPPVLDARTVRIGRPPAKITTIAYRPRFDKWGVKFKVIYNSRVISPAQLMNLYENAGFSVGLHEYRPEKSGDCGMFQVKRD